VYVLIVLRVYWLRTFTVMHRWSIGLIANGALQSSWWWWFTARRYA